MLLKRYSGILLKPAQAIASLRHTGFFAFLAAPSPSRKAGCVASHDRFSLPLLGSPALLGLERRGSGRPARHPAPCTRDIDQ